MDELESKLKEFFYYHNQEYSITKLIDRFHVPFMEIPKLIDVLYDLECQGLVYRNSRENYISSRHANFKFVCGQLQISNRNHAYVNLKDGRKVLLSLEDVRIHNGHVGDYLYIEPEMGLHPKCMKGIIKKVISKSEMPLLKNFIMEGTIQKNLMKNYYYVLKNNIEIPIQDLHGAFLRDKVYVEVNQTKDGYMGTVVGMVSQARKERVFILDNGTWTSFENGHIQAKIIGDYPLFENGTRVLATYEYNEKEGIYYIQPKKVIAKTNMDEDIVCLAEEYGFSRDFDEKLKKEILIPQVKNSPYDKRLDLRGLPTITIDPIYAKDLDDAVSLEKLANGYRLYVHIADVSLFVPFDSELMKEAQKRGTSCYLSHFVFPMLPPELSNHLCSLNPGEDKYAKTFEMYMDDSGNIKEFHVYNSLIRSSHQFDYGTVNRFLKEGIVEKEVYPYARMLLSMQELSDLLEKKKKSRGALEFDKKEVKFEYGAYGNAIHIEEEQRGPANKLIENFMLVANAECAKFAQTLDLPFVYRNHSIPSKESIVRLKNTLKSYHERVKDIHNFESSKNMQKYLLTLSNKYSEEELQYWAEIFLRSLPRARYDAKSYGHYGLNYKTYATVTSPIRRFADLANHTSISEYQKNGLYSDTMKRLREKIEESCDYISERQKIEDELERDVEYLLLQNYASNYQGELMPATIEFLGDGKILARSYNNIPGTIYLMGSSYDRDKRRIQWNNEYYYVGDQIQVMILPSKNKMQGIEFQMVSEKELKLERRKKS